MVAPWHGRVKEGRKKPKPRIFLKIVKIGEESLYIKPSFLISLSQTDPKQHKQNEHIPEVYSEPR